jgi:hypothetical protein
VYLSSDIVRTRFEIKNFINISAGFEINSDSKIRSFQRANKFMSLIGFHNEYYLLCFDKIDFATLLYRIEMSNKWKRQPRQNNSVNKKYSTFERITMSDKYGLTLISKVGEVDGCYQLYIFK